MSDELGPLRILAQKLRSVGPPSLSMILARINQMEDYKSFIDLVKQYLPERECDILREGTPSEQIATFASHFEDRYFPIEPHLSDGCAESYDELTYHIPVIVRGMSWEDYEGIASDARGAIQLMTYLIESPYEGDEARVSLAEACREHMPESVLQMVPENGFKLAELRELFNKTQHEGLVAWAEMINQDTGNVFLDTDYEAYGYCALPDWEPEEVENLTEEWQQADLIDERVNRTVKWLEVDLQARFEELLNFILERRKEVRDADSRDDGLPVGVTGKP